MSRCERASRGVTAIAVAKTPQATGDALPQPQRCRHPYGSKPGPGEFLSSQSTIRRLSALLLSVRQLINQKQIREFLRPKESTGAI